RVYTEGRDDEQRDPEEEGEGQLPPLAEGDRLRLLELVPEQHFTQPPPRFTQATLIKELEEKGIGRPSTYASIVGTILNKEYVIEDDGRRLKPTDLGFLVTDLLVESFPDVLNVEFTAGMEDQLDRIEEGEEHYVDALRRFWGPFAKDLEQAEVQMRDVKREERPTDLVCEKCGQPMVIKWGRRGEFLACRGYPECKNTKNFRRADDGTIRPVEPETTNEVCEQCGRPMQVRFGRYGKFLGCSGYPECRNMQPLHKPVPTGVRCLPGCGEGEPMGRRAGRARRERAHHHHRRRARGLRGGLAARPARHRRRPLRDAPAARHRGARDGPPGRARVLELLSQRDARDGGGAAQGGDAAPRLAHHAHRGRDPRARGRLPRRRPGALRGRRHADGGGAAGRTDHP